MKMVLDCPLKRGRGEKETKEKKAEKSMRASSHGEDSKGWVFMLCCGDCTNSNMCRSHLRPEEGAGSYGTAAACGWELPCGCREPNGFSARASAPNRWAPLSSAACVFFSTEALYSHCLFHVLWGGRQFPMAAPLSSISVVFFGSSHLTL